jgi:hypothetical protein
MTTALSPYEIEMAEISAYYAARDAAALEPAPEPVPEAPTTTAEPAKPVPTILSSFNDYFIRCRTGETETLYALAKALGVLTETEGVYAVAQPYSGAWSVVGAIYRATGQTDAEGQPIAAPVLDPEGQPYWHANLRINADLAEIAGILAPDVPEIAAGLASLARWFVVGADGKATAPKQPAQVWL